MTGDRLQGDPVSWQEQGQQGRQDEAGGRLVCCSSPWQHMEVGEGL